MARSSKPDKPVSTAQSLASIIKSARDIMRKDKGLNGDLDRLPMLTWVMFLKFLDDMEKEREIEAAMAGKRFRPALEPPYRWRDWAAKEDGVTGGELIAFINQDEAVRPEGPRALASSPIYATSRAPTAETAGTPSPGCSAVSSTAWSAVTCFGTWLTRSTASTLPPVMKSIPWGISMNLCSGRCVMPPATQGSSIPPGL